MEASSLRRKSRNFGGPQVRVTKVYKSLIQPLLFLLPPELAHTVGMWGVRIIGFLYRLGIWSRPRVCGTIPTQTPFGSMGSPLGLAAGFDKNAEGLWGWEALGFSFVEVGTVTPVAQLGNSQPRLFRYPDRKGLVNRMGFNNDGARAIAGRIRRMKKPDSK